MKTIPAEKKGGKDTTDWVYSKSLIELAPATSLDAVIRVLESYDALLRKQGRGGDADLIGFGIHRAKERLLNEMPATPQRIRAALRAAGVSA